MNGKQSPLVGFTPGLMPSHPVLRWNSPQQVKLLVKYRITTEATLIELHVPKNSWAELVRWHHTLVYVLGIRCRPLSCPAGALQCLPETSVWAGVFLIWPLCCQGKVLQEYLEQCVLEADLWNSGFQCPNSSSSLQFIKLKQLELTLDNRLSDFSPCFF